MGQQNETGVVELCGDGLLYCVKRQISLPAKRDGNLKGRLSRVHVN
jgi:hypothetical protein